MNLCYSLRDSILMSLAYGSNGTKVEFLKIFIQRTGFLRSLCFIEILQIRFASVDLELHSKYVPGGLETIYDVDRRVSERSQVIPPLPEDRFLCGFSHIFAGFLSLSDLPTFSASFLLI
jgi:Zn-dependent oligopeptidase